jgi:hypothetical protein
MNEYYKVVLICLVQLGLSEALHANAYVLRSNPKGATGFEREAVSYREKWGPRLHTC